MTATKTLAERYAEIAEMPARVSHFSAHLVHRRFRFDDLCPLCHRYGSGWLDREREAALGSDRW